MLRESEGDRKLGEDFPMPIGTWSFVTFDAVINSAFQLPTFEKLSSSQRRNLH